MVATPLASRVSRKLTRECVPPRVKELPREQVHLLPYLSSLLLLSLLFLPLSFSFSPFLTALRTIANPPYAPSGSYLRVLLIFSYYRHGHVSMFHTHTYTHTCKSSSYVHKVRSTSRFTGLPPSYSALFPVFLSSPILLFPSSSQVLLSGTPICEHIITEAREEQGRNARVMGSLSLSFARAREGAKTRGETRTRVSSSR